MKFLIDECLSPLLAQMACDAGHVLSAPVTYRGMMSWKDHSIMHRIISNDWTFVTQNGDDFRPRQGSASRKPCYVGVPLHADWSALTSRMIQRSWSKSFIFKHAWNMWFIWKIS